jgi:pilus assembly protein FimV
MAAAAAVLLLLGGVGFMVARRGKQGGGKKKASFKSKDDFSATGRIAAPIASSPETGDFTHAATAALAPVHTPSANTDSEEVDPIGEADLFLTFGRDAQAEEVLKEALKKNPNNIPVKLKLLSIYVTRKDTNSFYSYAREIKDSGDDSAWTQTAAMGRELDPSNPYYGGSAGSAAVTESKAAESAAPSVDFDLGFSTPAAVAAPSYSSQNTTIVLETEKQKNQETTTILSSGDLRSAAQGTPMDFDVTGTNPGFKAMQPNASGHDDTAALNMEDLVFDVTSTDSHPALKVPPSSVKSVSNNEADLAFTLDFPTDFNLPTEVTAKLPAMKPSIDLGDISLNLGTHGTSEGAEPKDERWHEVATKLDLAKAYQEMGDVAGAREILDEVLRDGDAQQRESAQTLMQQL